jgi:hypothetical protein
LAACWIFSPCSSVPVVNTTERVGSRSREKRARTSVRRREWRWPMCGAVRGQRGSPRQRSLDTNDTARDRVMGCVVCGVVCMAVVASAQGVQRRTHKH